MSAKNLAENVSSFFLAKKDVVKKQLDEVVRPQLEAKVEEIRAKAMEILKPPVEHRAEGEFTPVWRAFYGDAPEVSEESLIATMRSLFLDVSKTEAEMSVILASLPQGNGQISLVSFTNLLRSLGPLQPFYSHLRQFLELPFCLHVTSLEAACLLESQPVGSYLLRRRTDEASFSVCYVEATNAVREVGFSWHEKEEGTCLRLSARFAH